MEHLGIPTSPKVNFNDVTKARSAKVFRLPTSEAGAGAQATGAMDNNVWTVFLKKWVDGYIHIYTYVYIYIYMYIYIYIYMYV